MKFAPARLIEKKRDGRALSTEEIEDLVAGVTDGSLADAQLAALLMAGFLRGSNDDEIVAWTRAMRDSGRVLSRSSGPSLDKHSTGGVGDKVSLVLAPLLAACGARVPMISGRGLGHTGGTIDKLESIPGMSCALEHEDFERFVDTHGFVIAEAAPWLAPADRRMYAIRDVTATVACVPWITASILSKKLAAGLEGLILDVKCGRGAFMSSLEEARALATSLVRVAQALGCHARAQITDMDRPLGATIGNALEVRESIACLRGEAGGPAGLRALTIELGVDALLLGGLCEDEASARARLVSALDSGQALERFARFVEAQGGDARVVDDAEALLPAAPTVAELRADRAGFVTSLDPMPLALAALELGAGRARPGDAVDPAVGIELVRGFGSEVARGDVLARLHVRDTADAQRLQRTLPAARQLADDAPERPALVLARVEA